MSRLLTFILIFFRSKNFINSSIVELPLAVKIKRKFKLRLSISFPKKVTPSK